MLVRSTYLGFNLLDGTYKARYNPFMARDNTQWTKYTYPTHEEIVARTKEVGHVSGMAESFGIPRENMHSYLRNRPELHEKVKEQITSASAWGRFEWPPKHEVMKAIKRAGSYKEAAKEIGVSQAGMDRWLTRKGFRKQAKILRDSVKRCVSCGLVKDKTEFGGAFTSAKGRVSSRCKKCAPGRGTSHGVSASKRLEMIEAQNGLCAICCEHMERPHVDHCHETGKVRAMLCDFCNKGIGMLRDDPAIVRKAAVYLERREQN